MEVRSGCGVGDFEKSMSLRKKISKDVYFTNVCCMSNREEAECYLE